VKNLFVGNLGSEVTHEELRRMFRSLRTGGAGSYHRWSRHRAAARVCIRRDD